MKRPSDETLVQLGLSGGVLLVLLGGGALCLGAMARPAGAPELVDPAPNAVVETLRPTFRWRSAPGTAQVQFRLEPEGDAAGIDLVQGNRESFPVPAPEEWCCLKEGMTYRWAVRGSDSTVSAPEQRTWGSWSTERRFVVRASQPP